MKERNQKRLAIAVLFTLVSSLASAQDGVAGINAAASSLTSYVDPVATLIQVIGVVVGLIGGCIIYIKWNSGSQDINKELMGWGGACLFLVLVPMVVKAFFGV